MAAATLELSVVTPEADVLSMECDEVVVPGVSGEIGFMPGHVPLVTALKPGVLMVVRGGKRTYYAVSTGFTEIADDVVTVLTASCEESSQVDAARAKKALAEAEEKLKTLGPDDPTYAEQRLRAERAGARIEASQRR